MDDTKPPIMREPRPTPRSVPTQFPRHAAMFSLAAPFVGIGINLVGTLVARGNRWALLFAGLVSIILIVCGLVFGLVALARNRTAQLEGVTPRAVGGVCISAFLILLMAAGLPGLLRAMARVRDGQGQPTAQQEELK